MAPPTRNQNIPSKLNEKKASTNAAGRACGRGRPDGEPPHCPARTDPRRYGTDTPPGEGRKKQLQLLAPTLEGETRTWTSLERIGPEKKNISLYFITFPGFHLRRKAKFVNHFLFFGGGHFFSLLRGLELIRSVFLGFLFLFYLLFAIFLFFFTGFVPSFT